MSDEIDLANDQVQGALDMTMKEIRGRVKDTPKSDVCLQCGVFTGGRRWCGKECRDDYQKYCPMA